ncbi:SMP-30/gluconolactonase/LRE family protein [Streptomyces sp. KR80]|uniref:SMP-30/gluconolactonase/LRE family protein n=1 Tax=Streptomyces sp. KR80 TaxID=3457426 RepID=UPI003FD39BF5
MKRRAALAVLVGAAVSRVAAPAFADEARPRWDTRVFSLVPAPGFPATAYVHPNGRVYAGTYTDPKGDRVPSRVFEWTADGTLQRSWTVPGQHLQGAHGVQVAISDASGRLVLLDKSPGRALLLDPATGAFSSYATFPDLPGCAPLQPVASCSPRLTDDPAVPNFAAWGPDGSLYVTDYAQSVIWRVPPGGGAAKLWLADRRLDGGPFSTTGIALAGDRATLLVTQQSSAGLGEPNPTTGKLYAVPIRPDGTAGELRTVWESRPGDLPDGFAIARSGRIYISLVGSSQIAVITPGGTELERFPDLPLTGENGSSAAFDSPSSAAFLGTRILVANQSYLAGNPDHHAILDVETGEPGLPVFIPAQAGAKR